MSDSWNDLLNEVSQPFHDLAHSPRMTGALAVGAGVAAIAGVLAAPEVAVGIGIWEAITAATTATTVMSGTAEIIVGGTQLATGQDLKEVLEAAKNPAGVTEGVETVGDIKEVLTGSGTERLKAVLELLEKIDKVVSTGDKSGEGESGQGSQSPGDKAGPNTTKDDNDGGNGGAGE